MQSMPLDIGIIHFVGIGGIGMSGIAEVIHNLGYKVQGSDIAQNANVDRLRGLGIKVEVGHGSSSFRLRSNPKTLKFSPHARACCRWSGALKCSPS